VKKDKRIHLTVEVIYIHQIVSMPTNIKGWGPLSLPNYYRTKLCS